MKPLISVIIPIGPQDERWRDLLPDLTSLPQVQEILLVSRECPFHTLGESETTLPEKTKWISGNGQRAAQLNEGAAKATGNYLWFLHSDTRLAPNSFSALLHSIDQEPEALHFFDLRFLADGPASMKLNTLGVRIRSRWMRLPFGDQGFCISVNRFKFLGRFDEKAPFGEDHLLVWQAHQRGVSLRATGTCVFTSAQKYAKVGWAKTTGTTMYLTLKQALPELRKLLLANWKLK